jgi:hypothetical protein
MGSGFTDPSLLDLGTSLRRVFSFTPWPLYPWGKSPRYPLDRRLGGPQSRSGWQEVKTLAPTGTRNCDSSVVQSVASRYTGPYCLIIGSNKLHLFRIVCSVLAVAWGLQDCLSMGFVDISVCTLRHSSYGVRVIIGLRDIVVTSITSHVTDADQSTQATALVYLRIFFRPMTVLSVSAMLRIVNRLCMCCYQHSCSNYTDELQPRWWSYCQ